MYPCGRAPARYSDRRESPLGAAPVFTLSGSGHTVPYACDVYGDATLRERACCDLVIALSVPCIALHAAARDRRAQPEWTHPCKNPRSRGVTATPHLAPSATPAPSTSAVGRRRRSLPASARARLPAWSCGRGVQRKRGGGTGPKALESNEDVLAECLRPRGTVSVLGRA